MTYSNDHIYQDLRDRLVSAEFTAGMRMKADDLRAVYDCSASTIRENLWRLSCDEFLTFVDQKGFWVPEGNEQRLGELADFRILIEQQGIRDSLKNSNLEWEGQLAAAHHKLAHIENQMQRMENPLEQIGLWIKADRNFHTVLLAGSSSELMKSTHQKLFDQFHQMLVLTYGESLFGFRRGNIKEHEMILNAALEGDAEACCNALHMHIKDGLTILRDSLERDKIGEVKQ